MKLDMILRSNSVTIITKDPKVLTALNGLKEHMTTFDRVPDPRRRGSFIVVKGNSFVGGNHLLGEYIFNINSLKDLFYRLQVVGISSSDIHITDNRDKEFGTIDLNIAPGKEDRSHQVKFIEAITTTDQNSALTDLQTGQGKELSWDTMISIPIKDGKTSIIIKDLKVGDYVIGADGEPTLVTGHYPQGIKPLYNITFDDGRSVNAGLEHQWLISINNTDEVVTTRKLIEYLDNGLDVSIPMPLPIYDGIPLCENETALEIGMKLRDNINVELDLTSIQKAPAIQRILFISGLLDKLLTTFDGIHKVITSTNHVNILAIQSIFRSIGGYARIHEEDNSYVLTIKKFHKQKLPIERVVYAHDDEAYCISVDNKDKLYVTGNYIVTHNTYIASKSATILKHRIALVILPKYITKWIGDVKENMSVTDDDIMVIAGGHNVRKLIKMAEDKVDIPKILIFSNRTLYNYIKSYESAVDLSLFDYDVIPMELVDILDIGLVIVDEVHQEFYSVFKLALYFNAKLFLGLSATLITTNAKMDMLYKLLFPNKTRLSFMAYKKYIIAKSVSYEINNMRGVNYEAPGGRGYSQIALEQSIMRKSLLLSGYLKMIAYYVKRDYIDVRSKGQKEIIFCGTIAMCTLVTKMLKNKHPTLDVRRYTGDDDYENVIKPDIRVTTIQSAGAAIDIPNLIHVTQTVSVNSPQANLQAIGRLREIKGVDVVVTCIWSISIPKHRVYHNEKKKLFHGKIKRMELEMYPGYITC